MSVAEIKNPLQGVEIVRWIRSQGELQTWLMKLIQRGALVCTSPNRSERCDKPAADVFWQDGMEWYPCCPDHWPHRNQQWCGNTRFVPHYVGVLCFKEKINLEDEQGAVKVAEYDRTDAV